MKKLGIFLKIFAIASILFASSCSSNKKDEYQNQQQGMKIEDQVVDEGQYQVIDDETQAQTMQEKPNSFGDEQEVDVATGAVKEVEVQDRVLFSYDSAQIDSEAAKILDVQAQWLTNNPSINISIEGHCDERGTREYNIALGEKRALAAKDYLVKKGVAASRIKTVSYGKERPAFFGITLDIFSKNRRAVVVVN